MKYLAAASALLLVLVGCGRDEPHLPEPKTSTTHAFVTIPGSPTSTTLIPSDASTPAAGFCPAGSGTIFDFTINEDVPAPRCGIVHPDEQLQFKNNTDVQQTVDVGFDSVDLAPHESYVFPEKVGEYWAQGVHLVHVSPAPGPEVWLQS